MERLPKLINFHDHSEIVVNSSSFSVGRSLSADHTLQAMEVSRYHFILKKVDNKWFLFDRSTNGTFVNGTLYNFNKSVELKSGDFIKVGPDNNNLDFTFVLPPGNEEIINVDDPTIEGSDSVVEVISDDNQVREAVQTLLEVAHQFDEPLEVQQVERVETVEPPLAGGDSFAIVEDELTCSICSELFVKAVTLECAHTFCKYCLEQWKKNKSTCPMCRKPITTMCPTLVIDAYIEKKLEGQSDKIRAERNLLVQERASLAAGSSSDNNKGGAAVSSSTVYEISTDDEDMNDDDDDDSYGADYDDEYDDYDEDYNGVPGQYYGGYGRCYTCGQRGHWANGCPLRSRRDY